MVEYQTFIISPDFNISLVLKRILYGPGHVFKKIYFYFYFVKRFTCAF